MEFKELFGFRFSPKHSLANMPKNVSKALVTRYLFLVVSAVATQLYCFMLSGATTAVENGAVILGIVLFVMYHLRTTVSDIISTFCTNVSSKLDEMLSVDLAERSMNAMSKVSGKVVVNNEYITNSVLLTNLTQYVTKYRETKQALISFAINLIVFLVSIVSMIAVAVRQFSNLWLFALTIIGAVALNFVIAYKSTMVSQTFYERIKDLSRKREEQKNDCINMRPVCKKHSEFMLGNYIRTIKEMALCNVKEGIKGGIMSIKSSTVCAIAIIIIVVDAVIAVGVSNLDSVSFMNIISLATIFASILDNIKYKIADYQRVVSLKSELLKEEPLFEEIMKVYDMQKDDKDIENVVLRPFEFSYTGGNFLLKNEKTLSFKRGEMTLLRGNSGSGKSTLLKVLCGDLDVGSNPKIRTIHYSSEGSLGCASILDEITFGKVERHKLINILRGVQIYNLLSEKAEGKDILEYLGETKGGLSTGMQDRLMLARTLYNLDNASLVLIDEPIGGVDIETGRKIITFIKEYAARKMKKVVLVTTHQYDKVQEQFDTILDVKSEGCESKVA